MIANAWKETTKWADSRGSEHCEVLNYAVLQFRQPPQWDADPSSPTAVIMGSPLNCRLSTDSPTFCVADGIERGEFYSAPYSYNTWLSITGERPEPIPHHVVIQIRGPALRLHVQTPTIPRNFY